MSKNEYIAAQFPRKFGNYHLLAPLAQGGMGALYIAVRGDRGLERLLVIKTVLPHLADAEYIARFRDEAKVVVKLSHGNLIPVFDAGQVGGELFLAMEFVEGRDLRAVWNRCAKKQVAFPLDVAVFLTKELCRGLAYAHSFEDLKLVHRDVSPPNILMSYSGEVKLTDFGLASSTMKLEKTAPGIIYGKVAYMSPEQARGEPLDARSDLYAAAIVLWELLTGRQLFPPAKDQPQDLLKRARNPEVPAPSQRAPRVPAALDAICLKALAPRREDRYASGDEFREALTSWLAAEAPGTDAARVESFLHNLFAEDIVRERGEREELLQKIRKRVETMPPTDELRRMLEQGGEVEQQLMRTPGSVGRRAEDRGAASRDRRRTGERRNGGFGPSGPNETTNRAEGEATQGSLDGSGAIGQVIDGRYRIDELIGEGGMGRVFLAEHVEIGRRVAIKILHPVYSHMPDLVERFRREARAASRIGHPHIVDVTDSGATPDGSVYFVMEYLEGVDLGTVLEREGALEIVRALAIATQICRALTAAHAAGIIHRDLKPENIFLITRDGTSDFVKVLDFGIAKSTEAERARAKRLTSPGVTMGTPEYMAPEQAAGRPADERCDVYSVGAILYEILTGKPPYEGDNFMEVLTKKATAEPVPIKSLRPEVPEVVRELVVRAMARNPRDRPASMDALEYELNKCLSGRSSAVAKVLGMTADRELVASLNPGLSMRTDMGVMGVSGPAALPEARHPSMPSIPGMPGMSGMGLRASTANDLQSRDETIEVDISEPAMLSSVQLKSKWGVLGLVGAAAVLVLGVGAVLYAASGDDASSEGVAVASAGVRDSTAAQDADAENAGSAHQSADASKIVIEIPDLEPDQAVARRQEDAAAIDEAAAKAAAALEEADAGAGEGDSGERRSRSRSQDEEGMGRSEAKELLAKAGQAARRHDWAQARRLYLQVARGGHYRSASYLGLAEMAFESGDWDGTIHYANKARGRKGTLLQARAYYRKKDFPKARSHYEAVLSRDPNNKEAQNVLKAMK